MASSFSRQRNPNMEKALFDWPIVLQYDVKEISRKFFGHEVCLPERSLSQPKPRCVCIRFIHQSNRSISVRLLFLFCSRVFISRSYENRSNLTNLFTLPTLTRGRGFWKLNTSFLSETECQLAQTIDEYSQDNTVDPGLLWEMVKMKMREVSIKYGTTKKRNLRKEQEEIEISITSLEEQLTHSAYPLFCLSMTNKRNKYGAILKEKNLS